jgi:hypothetical protein
MPLSESYQRPKPKIKQGGFNEKYGNTTQIFNMKQLYEEGGHFREARNKDDSKYLYKKAGVVVSKKDPYVM